MSSDETSGRSCTTSDWGEPDEDCDDVEDDWDDCPGTALGAEVDAWGCSDAQNGGGSDGGDGDGGDGNSGSDATDTDGDGVSDDDDMCSDTTVRSGRRYDGMFRCSK